MGAMRHFIVLASLVVLSACAESQPPPPTQPQSPPATAPAATMDLTAQAQAQMQAAREESARQQAAVDADVKEAMRQAERAADPNVQRELREAPVRKKCEETRASRISHAKEMIIARMDAETRLLLNAKAIRAACKLTERKTGAVTVSQGQSGLRVAPELADDMKCGPLPKGITKDDAYIVLFRDRAGEKGPSGPILQGEDMSPDDGACTLHDAAVGLHFGSVTFDDMSTVERLRTWTPPAKAE